MTHPELTVEQAVRIWAVEQAERCLESPAKGDLLDFSASLEGYVLSAHPTASRSVSSGLLLNSGVCLLDAATVDRLCNLVDEVKYRFLIQHVSPDSLAASSGRERLHLLVNLFDKIFSGHNISPVSGLDTETVAKAAAGEQPAAAKG